MGLGISFSGQLAALYADFLDKTLERWQVLMQEARANNLTADHAVTEAMQQTADYIELMTFPAVVFRSPQPFVVMFHFTTLDDTATESIPFPDLGYTPKASALTIPGGGSIIPANKITVSYDKSKHELKIELKGLKALALKAETYRGDLSNPTNPAEILGRTVATVS